MAKTAKKPIPIMGKRMRLTRTPQPSDVLQEEPAVAAAAPGGTIGEDPNPTSEPDSGEIARLAFSYWEGRGGQGGSPEEDWFRARQELRAP
jgi:hypothetical protein